MALIRELISLPALVERHVRLTPRGGAGMLLGGCPFCQTGGALEVSKVRNVYRCRTCGAAGDAISFVQRTDNISFNAAIRQLYALVGLLSSEVVQ